MTVISAPTSFGQREDESVQDVAQHLSMQAPVRLWGPLLSSFLTICTCGLLPLLVWPRRWNAFAERERDQMASLAAWWRRRATPMQAQVLDVSISRMGPQSIFTIVPILILMFVGMMMVSLLNGGRSLESVIRLTVGYHSYRYWTGYPHDMGLHSIWTISLLVGYTCHWLAVRSHVFATKALTVQINEIAGVSRARFLPAISSGLNPIWILAAVALCSMNAWWGIPLVLAGAMQRKYCKSTSPRMRQALVGQLLNRPGGQTQFCNTSGCGAMRREQANFCPRCGAKV
jgi:hypothetical protein